MRLEPVCGAEPDYYANHGLAHLQWKNCIFELVQQRNATYGRSRVNQATGELLPAPKPYVPMTPIQNPPPSATALDTFWHNYGAMVVLGCIGAALIIVIGIALMVASRKTKAVKTGPSLASATRPPFTP